MTVWSLLEMAASAHPERVAFQRDSETVTVGQLQERARRGAEFARSHNAHSLVFVGISGLEWPTMLFAAAFADIPIVPLNYRLSVPSLIALIDRLDNPLVVADAAYAHLLGSIQHPSVTTEQWNAVVGATEPFAHSLEERAERSGPAAILFTSGTTSEPKGVLLNHSHLFSYVVQTTEFASAEEDEAAIVSVPPYHVAGLGTVLTNVFSGRRVVFLPDFSPAAWLATVRRERITQAMLVPTMLVRIVDELDGDAASVPSLRSIAYGGAAIGRPMLERALTAFAGVDFTNAYGLTETSSTIAVLGPGDHRDAMESDDEYLRARLGSAGRTVPGVDARIVTEHGDVCAPREVGELQVRGDQISGKYLDVEPSGNDHGWFATRDLAWVDEEGYLFIVGRHDDTIIRGGENIAPAEIEAVLLQHPAVADVAVVGFPDDEWGQRTVAVVVADESQIDAEGIRAAARAQLRGSRTPDDVVFVDELPYSPLGKLLRRDVLASLEQGGHQPVETRKA